MNKKIEICCEIVADIKLLYFSWTQIIEILKKDVQYIYRVRLMYALRAHVKPSIFGNIFSKIEKTVNTFSISKKMFLKMDDLIKSIYIL